VRMANEPTAFNPIYPNRLPTVLKPPRTSRTASLVLNDLPGLHETSLGKPITFFWTAFSFRSGAQHFEYNQDRHRTSQAAHSWRNQDGS